MSTPQQGFQGHPPSQLRNYQSSGDNSSVPPCRRGARCPKKCRSLHHQLKVYHLLTLINPCSRRTNPRSPGSPHRRGRPRPPEVEDALTQIVKLYKTYSGNNRTWPSSSTPRRHPIKTFQRTRPSTGTDSGFQVRYPAREEFSSSTVYPRLRKPPLCST